jgi:hypothetical protein
MSTHFEGIAVKKNNLEKENRELNCGNIRRAALAASTHS